MNLVQKLQSITEKPSRLCVGVMSGTSLDGLDLAFCRIFGSGTATRLEILHLETLDYTNEERAALLAACAPETSSVASICSLNKWLGQFIGRGIAQTAQTLDIPLADIDFIASHGQTVYHLPEEGATLQIGELADIAAETGVITVGDFRTADMAYGGEGAPLAPFFDWLICRSDVHSRILLNTGGIANITALAAGAGLDDLLAFDTGPANVLADNLMKLHTGGAIAYDKDGAVAQSGTISEALLQSMADEDPFLPLPPPKSTGRELYTYAYAQTLLARGEEMGLAFPDILATVVDYSAYCVQQGVQRFVPFAPDEFYQTGGGWHNLFFRERLAARLGGPMLPLSRLGIDGDAKEAAFFAVFGNEFLHGQCNNAKRATGANRDVIMGKLALPSPL